MIINKISNTTIKANPPAKPQPPPQLPPNPIIDPLLDKRGKQGSFMYFNEFTLPYVFKDELSRSF
ncbi:hypothetical protein BAC7755_56180 [Bacillus sp. MN7755]